MPRRFVPARRPEATPPNLGAGRTLATLPEHDLEVEGSYRGLDFVSLDLSGRTAAAVELDGCRFTGSDLGGSALDKLTMVDCAVDSCNVANMKITDGSMRRVRWSVVRMTGYQCVNGALRDVAYDECRLDLSTFRFSTLVD